MQLFTTALAQMAQGYGNRMDGWGDGSHRWIAIPMIILGLALLAAIIWGVIAVTRFGRSQPPPPPSGPSPLDILSQRYARGEIETADYEERKRLLS